MTTTIAPVLPMPPAATRTRKPRRRGSCSPLSYLRPRQLAGLDEKAVRMGGLIMEGGPEFAREVGEAIRLSLLQELASS